MRIKTSEMTVVLVIGLIVVTIAKAVYSPLHLVDIMEKMEYPTYYGVTLPSFIYDGIIFLFMPIMATMIEFLPYMGEFISALNDQPSRAFAAAVLLISYFVILYFLEKFHSSIHEEEGMFSFCIDMICIENISMYLYSIIIYHITQLIMKLETDSIILMLLFFSMLFLACVAMMIYMIYMLAGVIICCGIPAICLSLLEYKVNESLLEVIFLVLLFVFSQVVWRLVSDKLLNAILKKVSFGHLSLE